MNDDKERNDGTGQNDRFDPKPGLPVAIYGALVGAACVWFGNDCDARQLSTLMYFGAGCCFVIAFVSLLVYLYVPDTSGAGAESENKKE